MLVLVFFSKILDDDFFLRFARGTRRRGKMSVVGLWCCVLGSCWVRVGFVLGLCCVCVGFVFVVGSVVGVCSFCSSVFCFGGVCFVFRLFRLFGVLWARCLASACFASVTAAETLSARRFAKSVEVFLSTETSLQTKTF